MSKKITKEIYKIQIPLFNTGEAEALVYNKKGTTEFFTQINDNLLIKMDDRHKAFFYGYVKDDVFYIEEEAPWQEW